MLLRLVARIQTKPARPDEPVEPAHHRIGQDPREPQRRRGHRASRAPQHGEHRRERERHERDRAGEAQVARAQLAAHERLPQVGGAGRAPRDDRTVADRQHELDRLQRVALEVAIGTHPGGVRALVDALQQHVGVVRQHGREEQHEQRERAEGGPPRAPDGELRQRREPEELREDRGEVDVVEARDHDHGGSEPEAARARDDALVREGPAHDEDRGRDRPVVAEREVGERAIEEERRQREGARPGEGPLRPRPEITGDGVERECREHGREQDRHIRRRKQADPARQPAREPVLRLVLAQEAVPARDVRRAELGDRDPREGLTWPSWAARRVPSVNRASAE